MTTFDFESLAAIAQLGLGLAGFSGIGLVLTRTAGRLQRFELYRLGIATPVTLSGPSAATASAAVNAESIPPDKPSTTDLKPHLRT